MTSTSFRLDIPNTQFQRYRTHVSQVVFGVEDMYANMKAVADPAKEHLEAIKQARQEATNPDSHAFLTFKLITQLALSALSYIGASYAAYGAWNPTSAFVASLLTSFSFGGPVAWIAAAIVSAALTSLIVDGAALITSPLKASIANEPIFQELNELNKIDSVLKKIEYLEKEILTEIGVLMDFQPVEEGMTFEQQFCLLRELNEVLSGLEQNRVELDTYRKTLDIEERAGWFYRFFAPMILN